MCTVSWQRKEGRTTLWFNRDEQHGRAPAELPRNWGPASTPWLAPRDPDGGGTWLWVNAHGLTACLLNHYPRQGVGDGTRSRGLLLWGLASSPSLAALTARLMATNLRRYQAFHLLVVGEQAARFWTWDGVHLTQAAEAPSFFSTSSVAPERLLPLRQELWEAADDLRSLHYRFDADDPAVGPCMERDDARTVSISRVEIFNRRLRLDYQAKGRGFAADAWDIVTTAQARRPREG